MTSPAMAAIQEGARYQYRFFWREALPMLYKKPPLVEKVVMEHRGIEAVDDVVVYYTAPGVKDSTRLVRIDCYQLKFHVSLAHAINSSDLINPDWTGTKHSLLRRFADSWLQLRRGEPAVRLNLVTNWPWSPDDPLAPLIRDSGKLGNAFFNDGPGSNIGKVRAAWRAELAILDDDQFELFIRQLRLSPNALSQRESEDWLADRCSLAGLEPPNPAENHSKYDDLAGQLLAQGLREFTPSAFSDLVKTENLVLAVGPAFGSTCAVRSFSRLAHVPETEAAVVVDLTDLFTGRDPKREDVWSTTVPGRLGKSLGEIGALPRPVQLALDTHLSIAWYTGTLLDPKAGIPVVLRQKGLGRVELWDVSVARPDAGQAWAFVRDTLGDGPEIAIAISVTHDVTPEVRKVVAGMPTVGLLLTCTLPTLGGSAVRGGGHARALADALAAEARRMMLEREASRAHVFAAAPVSLAFLLGQQSAAIGPVTIYEYDFGRTRTYRPAMKT